MNHATHLHSCQSWQVGVLSGSFSHALGVAIEPASAATFVSGKAQSIMVMKGCGTGLKRTRHLQMCLQISVHSVDGRLWHRAEMVEASANVLAKIKSTIVMKGCGTGLRQTRHLQMSFQPRASPMPDWQRFLEGAARQALRWLHLLQPALRCPRQVTRSLSSASGRACWTLLRLP